MPRYAVYSGYQMDRETFKTFVNGLPGADGFFDSKIGRNFLDYMLAFNSWKNRLPPKQKRYVPKFRCRLIFPTEIYCWTYISFLKLASLSLRRREHLRTRMSSPPTSFSPFASSIIRDAVSSLTGIQTTFLLTRRRPQIEPSLIRWSCFWRIVVACWSETWLPLRIWRRCTPVLIGEMCVYLLPSFCPLTKVFISFDPFLFAFVSPHT